MNRTFKPCRWLLWGWLAVAVCLPGMAEESELIAFSLGRAEKAAQRQGNHLEQSAALGLTDLIGFVMDPAEGHDVIVFGRRRPQGFAPGPDGLAHLLRSAAEAGVSGPGVSLEPMAGDTNTLRAVYFGHSPGSNFSSLIAFKADLLMKEIALGTKPAGIPGLETYGDRVASAWQTPAGKWWEVLSRFWFAPSYLPVISDGKVWILRGAEVAVMVENLSASVGGVPVPDYKDTAAEGYAAEVMRRFDELSAVHPEFADLRALMGSFQLANTVLRTARPERLAYWLNGYRPEVVACPQSAPMLRRRLVTGQGTLTLHGGVRAAGLAIRLDRGETAALRELILSARPKDSSRFAWRVPLGAPYLPARFSPTDAQRRAAQHYLTGNRLRELRLFTEAAAEFDGVKEALPNSIEAQFLGAVCRRESLIASARAHELHRPLAELQRLATDHAFPKEIHYELAVTLAVMGRRTDAVTILENIVREMPDFRSARFTLGMCHYRLGNRDAALASLMPVAVSAATDSYATEARRVISELQSPPATAAFLDYESGTFSCPRPARWQVVLGADARRLLSGTSASTNLDVAFVNPRNSDCNIVIAVGPFPQARLTLDEAVRALPKIEAMQRSRRTEFKLVRSTHVVVNDVIGVRMTFTSRRGEQVLKQCITSLVHGGRMVTITCTAPVAEFDALWEEGFRICDEIRFPTLLDNQRRTNSEP